jgi:hypothetical protein
MMNPTPSNKAIFARLLADFAGLNGWATRPGVSFFRFSPICRALAPTIRLGTSVAKPNL